MTIRLDTGADVTVIPKHIADTLKLSIDTETSHTLRLVDASGNLMLVYGSADVYLTPTRGSLKGQTKKVRMVVTKSDKKDILLSVDELAKWGLLSDVFGRLAQVLKKK